MLPGSYYAAVFFRPAGGEWSIVGNGDYYNLVEIEVLNINDIEVYSEMELVPNGTWTRGQPASVFVNILNNGNETFYGTYSVDLYDLNGEWVENIGEVNEPNGLMPGYLYLDPFLNFTTPNLNAEAGTYLLAVTHRRDGFDWELTGSTYFQNPLYVTVRAPAIEPDIYENNNSAGSAYTLGLSFSGNTATKNTIGSSAHTGSDYDFYKINLPSGFDYNINVRMHDAYNSGNGNIYSLDGQFSYSFNGNEWSESIDDVLPGSIYVPNGGAVYFFATPYFLGQTGTYLVDMTVTRSPLSSTVDLELAKLVNVYPNPASEQVIVDLKDSEMTFDQLELINVMGQVVMRDQIEGRSIFQLPVSSFSEGFYTLRLQNDDRIVTKPLIITR
jgi:hypothetical protein